MSGGAGGLESGEGRGERGSERSAEDAGPENFI